MWKDSIFHMHAHRLPRPCRKPATLALSALLLMAVPAQAAKLIVHIDGVRSSEGRVVVALFNKPEGFPDGDYSISHVDVKAKTAPLTVVFPDLPPGTYAVGAYHDENGNARFDTHLFGFPAEGYALSNGIRAIIARPRFADACFPLGKDGASVSLHMGY